MNNYKNPRDAAAHMNSLAIEDIEILERMLNDLKATARDAGRRLNDGTKMGSIGTSDMVDVFPVVARAHRRLGAVTAFITLGYYQEEPEG